MSIRGHSSNSLEIDVRVDELLAILRTNRDKHVAEFNAQIIGWRTTLTAAIDEVQAKLEGVPAPQVDLKLVEKLKTNLYRITTPVSNEVDYTRTIGMLEMHQRAGSVSITLESQDYARYVDDEWDWKETFLSNSAMYTTVGSAR